MKLKMCGCWACRYARKSKRERYMIKHMRSACRSRTRRMLRKGEFDNLPEAVRVPYNG